MLNATQQKLCKRSGAVQTRLASSGIFVLISLVTVAASAGLSPEELVEQATLRIESGTHSGPLTSIAASLDGRLIVTGSEDRTVRLWDATTGTLVRTLRPLSQAVGLEGIIRAVAISPSGDLIAVGGFTRFLESATLLGSTVYLFETATGRLVRRLPAPANDNAGPIERLSFSFDGRYLLALKPQAHTAVVYDVRSGHVVEPQFQLNTYLDAAFFSDGRLLMLREPGYLQIYDRAFKRLTDVSLNASSHDVVRISQSHDGKRVALLAERTRRIELRSAQNLSLLRTIALPPADETLTSIMWAQDDRSLIYGGRLTADGSGFIRRVGLAKPTKMDVLYGRPAAVSALAELPGGGIAFAAADSTWGTLQADGKLSRISSPQTQNIDDPSELLVDQTGETVHYRYGPGAKDTVRLSLPALKVARGVANVEHLRSARIEVPPSHTLVGWRRQGPAVTALLDAAALNMPDESPAAMAVAPDRKSFVLGTDRRLARYFFDATQSRAGCPFSARPGSKLPQPCVEIPMPSAVRAVNFSGNGNLIIAALFDGSLHWYATSDGHELLAFYLHPEGRRWLLWQPNGQYAASIGGNDLVGWHVNDSRRGVATLFPLERFRKELYLPSVVAASLHQTETFVPEGIVSGAKSSGQPPPKPHSFRRNSGNAPGSAPDVAAPGGNRMAEESSPPPPTLGSRLPPIVTILSPAEGTLVPGGQATLRVLVHSTIKQPIQDVHVLVNGRAEPKARGIVDLGNAGTSDNGAEASPEDEVRSITVSLPPGESSVAVVAVGASGTSSPAVIKLRSTAILRAVATPEMKPRLLALVIGVGAYHRSDFQLNFPAKDARDLSAVLQQQKGRLYEDVTVRLLTDGQATLSEILSGLKWLKETVKPNDTAVLFMAGHGINEPGSGLYYFLPVDGDSLNIQKTMLPAEALQRELASLSGRVLLFLDTCHAGNVLTKASAPGAAPGGAAASDSNDITRFVNDLSSVEQGVVVMAAATGGQTSQESPNWQNGAFTHALVEGLRGSADFRKTGRVTVNMLDLYVSERVRELTQGAQTPATAKPMTIPDFALVSD